MSMMPAHWASMTEAELYQRLAGALKIKHMLIERDPGGSAYYEFAVPPTKPLFHSVESLVTEIKYELKRRKSI